MQDLFGSVRRSLVFKSTDFSNNNNDGSRFSGFVEKIGSSIRKSRIGIFSKPLPPSLPSCSRKDDTPPIRWRKGELIGCGAFGRVYMGMNLDSGELLAVKQVLIAANSASKEKTQAHMMELEEEVKLLKNLTHPNIVRYLGTAREDDSLNILLEFVPGGSISSLLGKFGSFPESVIRVFTKQLLLGLEYLHKNEIIHRDIKGANILVDNKGCIKLADFGASKKVVELATINGAKSMKGTPYWMAPEVILQTGHKFSADIWSVGCTVIEMATGKPPWSQQYQEVAALFHIGTTKSHPPIPDHLSSEAKDFLLKCLEKEPNLRPTASDLLQHPFVTGEYQDPHLVFRGSVRESGNQMASSGMNARNSMNHTIRRSTCAGLKDVCEMSGVRSSNRYGDSIAGSGCSWRGANFDDDDMCQIDDKDDFVVSASARFKSAFASADLNKSFNPMCEPTDEWTCKFDESSEPKRGGINFTSIQSFHDIADSPMESGKVENDFTFPSGPAAIEDDDEVTESKIRAFLDEKALDLKKLQTPLYEFYNNVNASGPASAAGITNNENITHLPSLPPKTRSPKRLPSRRFSVIAATNTFNHPSVNNQILNNGSIHGRALQEIQPPQVDEWKDMLHDSGKETITPSASFSERQRKWKEELVEELARERGELVNLTKMMRQAGAGGKASSPKDQILLRQRDRLRFVFPGK